MPAPDSLQSTTTLHNGVEMPWLGLGTWKTPDGQQVHHAVTAALDLGYRHIDTAAIYANEAGVGQAIADHSLDRKQIFLTTKIWNDALRAGYDAVAAAVDDALGRLNTPYADLILMHWPVGDIPGAWRALEDAYDQRKVRAIGVSNFLIHHLEQLLADARIAPMVNQYESHPLLTQPDLLKFCHERDIQPVAWSPIMQGRVGELPFVQQLADKYSKSPAQIVLRWDLQKGLVTIPKSVRPQRIAENADIFDFQLTAEDIAGIDALDLHQRLGADPDHVDF